MSPFSEKKFIKILDHCSRFFFLFLNRRSQILRNTIMEKCIFCGSTRKSEPSLRFFGVPREPGLKRIQWLYVLGDREVGPKDRVCAKHFRLGKPNSDPSHEDFVPNLFLNNDTPEYLEYLESLDDCQKAAITDRKRPVKPSILSRRGIVQQQQQKDAPTRTRQPIGGGMMRLLPIPKEITDAVPLKQGQKVVIKMFRTRETQIENA